MKTIEGKLGHAYSKNKKKIIVKEYEIQKVRKTFNGNANKTYITWK